MNIGPADLPKLRNSVLLALLGLATGAAIVYASVQVRESAERARVAATMQRDEADRKLRQVRDEESEIKQKSRLFNQLQQRGIIGEEQRLDWVELLKEIRDRRRLLDLRYDISPQRQIEGGKPGEFAFYASAMRLQLKLLHEEDLVRLLADLREQAKALIRVNRCRVERLPSGADERSSGRANLQADCELDWLTARETPAK